MKRRHLYGATVEPEPAPAWAACRADRFGGWAFLDRLFGLYDDLDELLAKSRHGDAVDPPNSEPAGGTP